MESMNEIWTSSPIYPARYQVSNFGRVRSLVSAYGKRQQPLIIRTQINNSGYQFVTLKFSGARCSRTVHRLVLKAFGGEPESGQECDHIDGDKLNNRIENLRWISRRENMDRLEEQGKRRRGERHGMAKLSDIQVDEIIRLKSIGMKQTTIAKKFNVGDAQISRILKGLRRSKKDLPVGSREVA